MLVTMKSNGYISTGYNAGEICKCMTVLIAFTSQENSFKLI
jgi:hypothetical protein